MAVKQTIPTYTNSTKSLTLGNFKGIDASSSPFEVNTTRATYCQNLINENGANHKRRGWTVNEEMFGFVYEHGFTDLMDVKRVTFRVNGKNVKATVFAGFCRDETDLRVAVKFDDNESYSSSEDYQSLGVWTTEKTFQCFESNGNIYFITCGNFYIVTAYEKDSGGYKASFGHIEYNSYKPTTTISINNELEEGEGATRKSFESANLLTAYRKNKLIGLRPNKPIEFRAFYGMSTMYGNTEITHLDIYKSSDNSASRVRFFVSDNEPATVYGQVSEPGEYVVTMYSGESTLVTKTIYIDHNSGGFYGQSTNTAAYGGYNFSILNGDKIHITYIENGAMKTKLSFSNKRYKLDSKAKNGTTVKITIKSKYKNLIGSAYSCKDTCVDGYEVIYPGEVDFNFFSATEKSNDVTEHYLSARIENDGLDGYVPFYLNGEVAAIYHDGYISFFIDTEVCVEGEDNIEVEYCSGDFENSNIISKCTYGIEYLGRMLLAGNEDYPALIYFSAVNDFTYFPYVNFNSIGMSSNKIVGFTVLNDSTIAVHKSDNNTEATIYYIKPSEVDLNELTEVAFSVKTGTMGETPVNNDVCKNLMGDNLILSKNGVYGISLKSNISTDDRYAFERSALINPMLSKHADLSSATAIVYKNRYYLAIDNVVYIADARFKTSPRDQDPNDTFNYEWWYWTNMPVKKWVIINNELCFVSKTGNVMNFYDGYEDVDFKLLQQGALTKSSNNDTSIVYSKLLENYVTDGSRIELSIIQAKITNIGDIKAISKVKDEYFDIYFFDNKKVEMFKSGTLMHSCWQNGTEVYIAIDSTDTELGKITIRDVSPERILNPTMSSYFTLESRFDTKFYICNTNKYAQTFDLKLTKDGDALEILYLEMKLGALYSIQNVVSVWKTPILSLGTTTYSKNLLSSTLVCEPNIEGAIEYGCRTNEKLVASQSELNPINGFDFDNIDFTNLSFEEGLARSRTIKKKIRNFNFIEFIIKSVDDKNCAVNNLTIVYNTGRKNKGVR